MRLGAIFHLSHTDACSHSDYRGLKKRIGAIRRDELGTLRGDSSDNDADADEDLEGGTRLSTIPRNPGPVPAVPRPPTRTYYPSNAAGGNSSSAVGHDLAPRTPSPEVPFNKNLNVNEQDHSSDSNDTDADKTSVSPLTKSYRRCMYHLIHIPLVHSYKPFP